MKSLTRRRHLLLTVPGALLVIGTLLSAYFCLGIGRSRSTWERPGAMQVLTGPQEAWAFIEIDRVIRSPALIASPAVHATSHHQYAVRFDRHRVLEVIQLPPDEPTFNHNVSQIFRLQDAFYLLHQGSKLYRWSGDQFSPIEASKVASSPLPALATQPANRETPLLDAASQAHGWTRTLTLNDWFRDVRFRWDDGDFEFTLSPSSGQGSILLHRNGDDRWTSEVIRYDTTPRKQ